MNNKEKKLSVLVLSAIAVFFTVAPFVNAHVLEYDQNIGAVVHVTPNDDPATHEETVFNIEITDTENVFDSKECICSYTLALNTEVVAESSFETEKTSSGTNFFKFAHIFEEKGTYTLELKGKAKNGLFKEFALKYDIRVAREGEASEHHEENHTLHIIIFGIGFIVAALVLSQDKYSKKNQ